MPSQRVGVGAVYGLAWSVDGLSVQGIVVLAVFELSLDALADLKVKVGRHSHVAGVEEAVDVSAQQQAVAGLMRAAVAVGADMGGFQGEIWAKVGDA